MGRVLRSIGNTKRAAMMAVVAGGHEIEAVTATAIVRGRSSARESAAKMVSREAAVASRVTGALIHTNRVSANTDHISAVAAAGSYRAAWLGASLAAVLSATRRGASVPKAVETATARLDHRLDTIAATEVSQAWNDEHRAEWDQVATDHRGAIWLGLLLRRWDATLDRKVCAVCRAHDGEVRVIGFDFDGGDEPGFVHPRCRCQSSTYTATTVAARILSEAA